MSITVSMPMAPDRHRRAAGNRRRTSISGLVTNRDDIGRRHGADHVEDRAIALEHAEEDVVAADRARRARDRVLREHRGALLDEFEEENLARRALAMACASRPVTRT